MKALQQFTDQILLDRCLNGDTKAFNIIYERYVSKIFRFIFFRVNEKELVDDLVNEVFLRLWQQIQQGKKITNVKAYIYKITRHIIIDHYRSRKEQLELDSITHLHDENQDLIGDILIDSDIKDLLKRIENLRNDYKEILILRYVEDLTITEIAAILDKSKGAVKVIIHRAVNKLKSDYDNK